MIDQKDVNALPSVKDLVTDGNMAKFVRLLLNTNMVYEVKCGDRTFQFQFPIDDLGDATVSAEEKAITLMRYIRKALNESTLVEVPSQKGKNPNTDQEVIFSHYRKGVLYYHHIVDAIKYVFPLRIDEIVFEEPVLYVPVSSMTNAINRAKTANEYHPC